MKGEEYEERAEAYLRDLGWEILERNFRCRRGEIDIIARDGKEIVFVEVKGGRTLSFGDPAERFSRQKLRRILECAYHFIQRKSLKVPFRIDLVVVRGEEIEHFRNIGFD